MKNTTNRSAFALAFLIVALPIALRAQATLTISPAVITNDFVGPISVTVSNVVPGQKIFLERYMDVNGDGVIDFAQEPLQLRVGIIDGNAPFIGGVRNIAALGDEDFTTNGRIHVVLSYPGLNAVLSHIAGNYIYRVVDATGVFAPLTASFSVVQKPFPQKVSGTLYSAADGQRLPYAIIVMVQPQGNTGIGTVTDALGNYSLSNAPGSYALLAIKTGFVADQSAGMVNLGAGSSQVLNLTNTVATRTLSGRISDISNGKGLGGIFMQAEGGNNLFTLGFTDTNGNYSLPVTPDQWKVKHEISSGVTLMGYVGLQNNSIQTNTVSGSVSNLDFQFLRGTALIYGHVSDNLANPVVAIGVGATDSGNTYEGQGQSVMDGSYAVAVTAGTWNVSLNADDLLANGWLGQSASVTVANGQAVLQNLQIQRPTAHLRGKVIVANGNPLGNFPIVAFPDGNGANLNLQTAEDGTFDIGVTAGAWNIQLECGSAASQGLVGQSLHLVVTDGVDQNNLVVVAQPVTGYITGNIIDSQGNPVAASVYAGTTINGTNYNVCGGNNSSTSFQLAVFNGVWQLGVAGDVTSQGYDNPNQVNVTSTGGTNHFNLVLYALGMTPPRIFSPSYIGGSFHFMVWGDNNQNYRVDTTTDPGNPAGWQSVVTNRISGGNMGGSFSFTDDNASGASRYYRVVRVQ